MADSDHDPWHSTALATLVSLHNKLLLIHANSDCADISLSTSAAGEVLQKLGKFWCTMCWLWKYEKNVQCVNYVQSICQICTIIQNWLKSLIFITKSITQLQSNSMCLLLLGFFPTRGLSSLFYLLFAASARAGVCASTYWLVVLQIHCLKEVQRAPLVSSSILTALPKLSSWCPKFAGFCH